MPSVSNKQRRFMAAAAKNPDFARKAGIKPSDAKEFFKEDKALAKPKKRKAKTKGKRR